MNPDLKKCFENHIHFLINELDECNKRAALFHSAFSASESLWRASHATIQQTHPNLAYKLRCLRENNELKRKTKSGHKEIETLHRELTELRREKRMFLQNAKNLKKAADGFLGANPRSSERKLAAENTRLLAELEIYKMKKTKKK